MKTKCHFLMNELERLPYASDRGKHRKEGRYHKRVHRTSV